MANIGELVATMKVETTQFKKGLTDATKMVESTAKKMEKGLTTTLKAETKAFTKDLTSAARTVENVAQRMEAAVARIGAASSSFTQARRTIQSATSAIETSAGRINTAFTGVAGGAGVVASSSAKAGAGIKPLAGLFGSTSSAAGAAAGALSGFNKVTSAVTSGVGSAISSLTSFRGILASLAIGAALKEIFEVGTNYQTLQNAFEVIKGSATGAGQTLGWVREQADRLGVDFLTAANSFKQLSAAAMGTKMSGEQVQKVFTSVAEAGVVLGLSNQRLGFAYLALEQMMSKNVVQMEELRRQLGEHIPGAVSLAAKAMGVSVSKLQEMVKEGKVLATDLLPKLADVLHNRFGKGVEAASNMAIRNLARFKNAVNDSLNTIASSGFMDAISKAAKRAAEALKSDEMQKAAERLGQSLGRMIELLFSEKSISAIANIADGLSRAAEAAAPLVNIFEMLVGVVGKLASAWSALPAWLQGAGVGAAAGGMLAGPWGALAGALMGAVAQSETVQKALGVQAETYDTLVQKQIELNSQIAEQERLITEVKDKSQLQLAIYDEAKRLAKETGQLWNSPTTLRQAAQNLGVVSEETLRVLIAEAATATGKFEGLTNEVRSLTAELDNMRKQSDAAYSASVTAFNRNKSRFEKQDSDRRRSARERFEKLQSGENPYATDAMVENETEAKQKGVDQVKSMIHQMNREIIKAEKGAYAERLALLDEDFGYRKEKLKGHKEGLLTLEKWYGVKLRELQRDEDLERLENEIEINDKIIKAREEMAEKIMAASKLRQKAVIDNTSMRFELKESELLAEKADALAEVSKLIKDQTKLRKALAQIEESYGSQVAANREQEAEAQLKVVETYQQYLSLRSAIDSDVFKTEQENKVEKFRETYDKMKQIVDDFTDDSKKALSESFLGAFKGDLKDAAEAFEDFSDSIIRMFTDMLADMMVQSMIKPIIVPIVTGTMFGTPMQPTANGGMIPVGSFAGGAGGGGGTITIQGPNGPMVIPASAGTTSGGGVGMFDMLGGVGQIGSFGMNNGWFGSMGNSIGSFMSAPLWTTSTGGPATSAITTLGPSLGGALMAGGLASIGYSTLGKLIGLPQSPYSGITAGLGGGLGFLGGSAMGATGTFMGMSMGSVVPVIGTIIGAVLGGLVGSLFGGGSKEKKYRDIYPGISMGGKEPSLTNEDGTNHFYERSYKYRYNAWSQEGEGRSSGMPLSEQHDMIRAIVEQLDARLAAIDEAFAISMNEVFGVGGMKQYDFGKLSGQSVEDVVEAMKTGIYTEYLVPLKSAIEDSSRSWIIDLFGQDKWAGIDTGQEMADWMDKAEKVIQPMFDFGQWVAEWNLRMGATAMRQDVVFNENGVPVMDRNGKMVQTGKGGWSFEQAIAEGYKKKITDANPGANADFIDASAAVFSRNFMDKYAEVFKFDTGLDQIKKEAEKQFETIIVALEQAGANQEDIDALKGAKDSYIASIVEQVKKEFQDSLDMRRLALTGHQDELALKTLEQQQLQERIATAKQFGEDSQEYADLVELQGEELDKYKAELERQRTNYNIGLSMRSSAANRETGYANTNAVIGLRLQQLDELHSVQERYGYDSEEAAKLQAILNKELENYIEQLERQEEAVLRNLELRRLSALGFEQEASIISFTAALEEELYQARVRGASAEEILAIRAAHGAEAVAFLSKQMDDAASRALSLQQRLAALTDSVEDDLEASIAAFDLAAAAQIRAAIRNGDDLLLLDKILYGEKQKLIRDFYEQQAEEERRYQEQIENIRQNAQDAWLEFFQNITKYLESLKTQVAPHTSPSSRLSAAREQFFKYYELAKTGDKDAMANITKYADVFLKAGQDYYGSSSGYQDIYSMITSMLGALPEQISIEELMYEELQKITKNTKDASDAIDLTGSYIEQTGQWITAMGAWGDKFLTEWDKSADQQLTADEFLSGIREMSQSDYDAFRSLFGEAAIAMTPEEFFSALDKNNDGIVSTLEINTAMLKGLKNPFQEWLDGFWATFPQKFNEVDVGLDGLDMNEFALFLSNNAELKDALTNNGTASLDDLWKAFDKNKDGVINQSELEQGIHDSLGDSAAGMLDTNQLLAGIGIMLASVLNAVDPQAFAAIASNSRWKGGDWWWNTHANYIPVSQGGTPGGPGGGTVVTSGEKSINDYLKEIAENTFMATKLLAGVGLILTYTVADPTRVATLGGDPKWGAIDWWGSYTHMASGGLASGFYMAGEHGPELITSGPANVHNASDTAHILAEIQADSNGGVRDGIGEMNRQFRKYRSQSAVETEEINKRLDGLNRRMDDIAVNGSRAASAAI